MNDFFEYQRALYLALMMIASADKDFDERENEVIYDIIAQVLPKADARNRFIRRMAKELERGQYRKEFMTLEFFRKQAGVLTELNNSSKKRILDLAGQLVDADGMETHRERFLLEELQQALSPDPSGHGGDSAT